jgi:acetyltransferase-like isoleucine patch superfamily enzyme
MLTTVRRLRDVTQRGGGWANLACWPESRAALRRPVALDPPAPREFAYFGENSWIVPPARIQGAPHISIGAEVVVMEHVEIRAEPAAGTVQTSPLVYIGDGTRLARFITIFATVGVHIGDRVSTSDYVAVTDCWHQPDGPCGARGAPPGAPVVIEDGSYLGCGCFIGPGVTVGRGAFVGEGAVVFEDVPPHSVVYGNPASITRCWTAEGGWQGNRFGRPE